MFHIQKYSWGTLISVVQKCNPSIFLVSTTTYESTLLFCCCSFYFYLKCFYYRVQPATLLCNNSCLPFSFCRKNKSLVQPTAYWFFISINKVHVTPTHHCYKHPSVLVDLFLKISLQPNTNVKQLINHHLLLIVGRLNAPRQESRSMTTFCDALKQQNHFLKADFYASTFFPKYLQRREFPIKHAGKDLLV